MHLSSQAKKDAIQFIHDDVDQYPHVKFACFNWNVTNLNLKN